MISKKVKLPKKYWVKGKSKFLDGRPELKNNNQSFLISDEERERQAEKVRANRERRFKKYGKY